MATPSRERQLIDNVWQYKTVEESGGGGTQNLAQVLAEGADAGGLGITNLLSLSGLDSLALGDNLTAGLLQIFNGAGSATTVICGPQDPSEGASANPGSIFLRTNGQAWLKTGAGNTDWTQIGGSPAGAIQVVRVPIAFNTPDLVLSGVTAYTPAVGDVLLESSFLSVTTAWDGATPGLSLYSNGDGQSDRIIDHTGLEATNQLQGSSIRNSIVQREMGSMYLNASSGNHIIFDTTAAVKLMVDDGAGGDPGSAAGAGVFTLIIAPAS